MIIAEGTLWPVVMVGAVKDPKLITPQLIVVTDRLLELSDRLAIGLVVGGTGIEAARAHQAMLEWWRDRQKQLFPRTRRLAWVIEDESVRRSTTTWVRVVREDPLAGRWAVFPDVRIALTWLLDTPWPLQRASGRRRARTGAMCHARVVDAGRDGTIGGGAR